MEEKLKIKVSIADRVYPMTVSSDQEQSLRLAAQKINKTIKHFEDNYAVRDKQDVLAMSALQFASKIEQNQIDTNSTQIEINHRLISLNDELEKYIS
ncbi:cell division protein ZapA [Flavobacterium sp. CS20]|uniref:cell division protein ZapA n=1 Tax=Flavobacterium sp. CS20 TaxID=2775246 RepID=UPI001B39E006|nr:cell division protein ZapA [Flavobacterium sp. CS20]QTY27456.1 cell division protein ZapA [Flavobacterium sp. CS20]